MPGPAAAFRSAVRSNGWHDRIKVELVVFVSESLFVGALFSHVIKNERPKIDHTKIDKADLDSSRRELSVGGLGFVVALSVCW